MTLLEIDIAATADDGHIDDTSFFNSGNSLWLGSSGGDEHVFLSFIEVAIPVGATIDNAKITFELESESASTDITGRIAAEDAADPTVFDSYSGGSDPWTGRTSTTATVDWTLDATWTAGAQDTPDIAAIIQELIDIDGWASGNDMLLWVESISPNGGEEWEFQAFNDPGVLEPRLVINYTAGIIVEQTRSKSDGSSSTDTITDTMTGIDAASHVILVCHSGSSGIATPPSGWTEAHLSEELTGGGPGAGGQCVAVYWKDSPSSSEAPSIVFDHTEDHGMYMLEVSGLLASPEDDGKENRDYRGADSSRTVQPGPTGTLTQAKNIVVTYTWVWAGDQGMTIDSFFVEDPGDIHDGFLNLLTGYKVTTVTDTLNPTTTWDTDDADAGAVIATFKADVAVVTDTVLPHFASMIG